MQNSKISRLEIEIGVVSVLKKTVSLLELILQDKALDVENFVGFDQRDNFRFYSVGLNSDEKFAIFVSENFLRKNQRKKRAA